MASEKEEVAVAHDRAKQRFVAVVDGKEAYLEYSVRKADGGVTVFDFFHTFTDPSLRGRGLASRVTEAALVFVQGRRNARVVPSCSYVAHFLEKRAPRFADLWGER